MKAATILLIILLVMATGCIRGTEEPQVVYIEPCNILTPGSEIKIAGQVINKDMLVRPLADLFLDDIISESRKDSWNTYQLNCWWGVRPGEVLDRYYCVGTYAIPEVDDNGKIVRYVQKSFKVGLSVEKRTGDTWIDVDGKIHSGETYLQLKIESVEQKCKVAQ